MSDVTFPSTIGGMTITQATSYQPVDPVESKKRVADILGLTSTSKGLISIGATSVVFVSSPASGPASETGAERLRRLREQLELTEDEAAEVLGWPKKRLAKLRRENERLIAKGKQPILPSTLYRQAKNGKKRKSKKGVEYAVKGKVFSTPRNYCAGTRRCDLPIRGRA